MRKFQKKIIFHAYPSFLGPENVLEFFWLKLVLGSTFEKEEKNEGRTRYQIR